MKRLLKPSQTQPTSHNQTTFFKFINFYICRTWQTVRPSLFCRGKMYCIRGDEETDFVRVKRYTVTWTY
ncbi:MAG: hypothetical protein JXB26_08350 [Candidatus Aminicenantes bacterium]|nr:hypothetical protein [Candidatus Aminicenantes bacterium]